MTWRRVALYYVLFGVVLLYYWGSQPEVKGPPTEAEDRVRLVDVRLERIVEVQFVRADARVRCRQERGRWRVVEPRGARVPADLISSFVMTLVEMRAAEVVAEREGGRGRFGLGPEALRIELYQRGHQVPVVVRLGHRNPTETAVYARVEGAPRVLLVGRVLEYYATRVFEEARQTADSNTPAVDAERADRTG
jgi:hypothetical protein